MIVDIIDQKNYNSYNIKVAQIWGLDCAVYFNTIFNLRDSANLILVDSTTRQIIKDMTMLTSEQQKDFDSRLISIGVIEKIDSSNIKINVDKYIAIFNTDDIKVIEEVSKVVKKKKTKADFAKDELRTLIKTADPELRDCYAAWIDAVFSKQGWMSRKSVEVGQDLIDKYAQKNTFIIKELLDIAAINGYRDIQWAINKFEEDNKKQKKPVSTNTEIKLATDLF